MSKVNDMLAKQPGAMVEVPGGNRFTRQEIASLAGMEPADYDALTRQATALGDVIEGRPLYTADDTKPIQRTVLSRLATLERTLQDARTEWSARHTTLVERNRELEAEVAQLRAELGTPEP